MIRNHFEYTADGNWVIGSDTKGVAGGFGPDASHLIGERVTADGADWHQDGWSISGDVASVVGWTPDERHVIVRLASGYTVRIPRALVEATAPKR